MRVYTSWFKIGLLVLVLCNEAKAQVCGTRREAIAAIQERLLANKAALTQEPVTPRSTQYVPIKFHLVQKDDGSGGILLRNVLEQLCALNNDFLSVDIQFYLKDGVNLINDDRLYSQHFSFQDVMRNHRDPNALNIWVLDNADPAATDYIAGYYINSEDWVVIQKTQISAFTFTLPHEVGHFFGLLHTFNGWDADPWQLNRHGNPAPSLSPQQIPTELQNRSNCNTSGDFICDTPPDYNFGAFWLDCNFTQSVRDPSGTIVNPDERNFMGYFDACVRNDYRFSPQQKALMKVDASKEDRQHLRSGYTPEYLQFSDIPTLELPAASATVAVFDSVHLQWTIAEGANQYLVEVSNFPTFTSTSTQSFVVTNNQLTVKTLEPNKTYFWRVRPFNEYFTCSSSTGSRTFRTGNLSTSIAELQSEEDWQVHPNPQHSGAPLFLELKAPQSFEAALNILNLTGTISQPLGKQLFTAGHQKIPISTLQLPPGVYLLSLQTKTGKSIKKIILQ